MGTPTFKALLMGTASFERDPHNLPPLKGPPQDLKLLQGALTDPEFGLYDAANVRTVLDPTHAEAREAIDDFFNTALPDDHLLFYYTGHGRQDANNSLYLCARDTRTDRLASTAVGDMTINQMIATSHAARTLIILDCCHSGSFKGGGLPEALVQASGRFLLTSCRNQQLAADAGTTSGASAFTSQLVSALTEGAIDPNQDGYVTLSEVYHYILPKLKQSTQQIPQLHLDKTVGDPPLARVRPRGTRPAMREEASEKRPALALSEYEIDLKDVRVGEELPKIVVDVFNEGGGRLDWRATTEDAWIAIEPSANFISLKLNPARPGPHRGNVYVRDQGRGGSRRLSVVMRVLAPEARPELSVAQDKVDFGRLRVGASPQPVTLSLANRGSGDLHVRASSSNPALRVTASDTFLTIQPEVSRPGSLAGQVVLESRGGRAIIAVSGLVEAGPVLAVKPGRHLDFGRVRVNEPRSLRLTIENEGDGSLEWTFRADGNFFRVEREGATFLKVTLGPNPPDSYLGTLIIQSNGGEATVTVQAEVVPGSVAPPMEPAVILAGWWQTQTDRIFINGSGTTFEYTVFEQNLPVGGGTMTLTGNRVFAQGNTYLVPHTAEFVVSGAFMTGTVMRLGMAFPASYSRC